MKRLPGMPPTPSRQRHIQPQSESEDIDLSEIIRERDARQEPPARRPHVNGRRPGNRTGGRIRMDAANSTVGGPRQTPIPTAPKYQRNRRPRNWAAVVLTTLLVIGAIAGIAYAFTTPKLAIRNIEIDGVPADTAQSLQNRIVVDPLGHNLLAYVAFHGRALRTQMTNAEADFAATHIGVRFPGTLLIAIDMRKPYALLTVGPPGLGSMYVLDDRGVPIQLVDHHPKGLLKIMIPLLPAAGAQDAGALVLGRVLPDPMRDSVTNAYGLINELRSWPALAGVRSIQVDKSNDLGLNMSNHLRVKLGQPQQLSTKLSLMNNLLTEHPNLATEALYIDVSSPSCPAMMPKAAVEPNKTNTAQVATPKPIL